MAQIKVNVATATTGELATANIANSAITTAKIAADAVTDAKVADDVIGTEHLTAGEVDTTALGADSVTAAKIGDNVINSEHYAATSIDNEHIGTDIDASKIATGTFANARISSSSVTQHVTAFDDTDLRSDIITLALKEAITENRVAYNLPNSMIEQFQDDSKLGTETTGDRNASEYWSTITPGSVDSYTKLLIHSDTSDESTTMTDSGVTGHTLTAQGSTNHETDQKKFGASSLQFDSNGDYIETPQHADFDLGTGAGTLECWVYLPNTFASNYFGIINTWSSSAGYGLGMGSGTGGMGVRMRWSSGASPSQDTASTALISVNTWTHIAAVVYGDGTGSLYINGTRDHQVTNVGALNRGHTSSGGGLYVGSNRNSEEYSLNGFIDEVRLSKGIARYTGSSFTVPTTAFPLATVSATGTLISTANTANAAQTKVSGVILYKNNSGTATLGTDLKIYFTCNGGTNWTESTPTAAGTFSSGILMAKCPEVTCTSGTDVRYKAVWANQALGSKDTQLHGIGMNY